MISTGVGSFVAFPFRIFFFSYNRKGGSVMITKKDLIRCIGALLTFVIGYAANVNILLVAFVAIMILTR